MEIAHERVDGCGIAERLALDVMRAVGDPYAREIHDDQPASCAIAVSQGTDRSADAHPLTPSFVAERCVKSRKPTP